MLNGQTDDGWMFRCPEQVRGPIALHGCCTHLAAGEREGERRRERRERGERGERGEREERERGRERACVYCGGDREMRRKSVRESERGGGERLTWEIRPDGESCGAFRSNTEGGFLHMCRLYCAQTETCLSPVSNHFKRR